MHVANKHANGTDANDGESRRFSAQKLQCRQKMIAYLNVVFFQNDMGHNNLLASQATE